MYPVAFWLQWGAEGWCMWQWMFTGTKWAVREYCTCGCPTDNFKYSFCLHLITWIEQIADSLSFVCTPITGDVESVKVYVRCSYVLAASFLGITAKCIGEERCVKDETTKETWFSLHSINTCIKISRIPWIPSFTTLIKETNTLNVSLSGRLSIGFPSTRLLTQQAKFIQALRRKYWKLCSTCVFSLRQQYRPHEAADTPGWTCWRWGV